MAAHQAATISWLKKAWDTWDIPACMMLSLSLQVFLVLFAYRRQRSRNRLLQTLIWLAYLAADWVAPATIGLIGRFIGNATRPLGNEGLYAFWASFLLLHLGGPDCITSYSVEDNELWRRHMFQLLFQVVGAAYCIFLMPSTITSTKLWLPTALVFVVGTVKYAERTVALYLGSMDKFGATAMPKQGNIPDSVPQSDMDLVTQAYPLFSYFKGLFAGYTLTEEMISKSRKYFKKMGKSPEKGFKVIENEVSLMYEAIHTKVCLLVGSQIGVIFRLTSFCFIVLALVTFHFVVDASKFGRLEISLTYALLTGALILDTISGIQLILSDWILVSNGFERWRELIPAYFWKRKRWSGSVPQYNIMDYYQTQSWMYKLPDFVRDLKVMLFSRSIQDGDADIEDIKSFIFRGICDRSLYKDPVEDFAWKDDDQLQDTKRFTSWIVTLHVTTEIYYHLTERGSRDYAEKRSKERRRSKVISDYVFYLLLMEPAMLAPVAIDDWREYLVENFFSDAEDKLKGIKSIISVEQSLEPEELEPSCRFLTQPLEYIHEFSRDEGDWERMSSAWVNVLVKGAFNCRPILHMKQPSSGGQLLTFTWLLARHFALDTRLPENETWADKEKLTDE